jgi:C_GCAxxG_C_C family probable redox protein
MNKSDKAVEYFRNKYNCSQSVFVVFSPESGVSENDSLKAACAFGGGMGRQQLTCGAVTGALMAIGMKYGKALNEPEEKKLLTYAKTKEFFEEFKKLNGSVSCKDLLNGLDMNDPEDHKKIIDQGLFDTMCEKYVVDAVNLVEKIVK